MGGSRLADCELKLGNADLVRSGTGNGVFATVSGSLLLRSIALEWAKVAGEVVADERSGTLLLRSVDFLLSLLLELLSLLGVPSCFFSLSLELRFSFGDSRFTSELDDLDEDSAVRFFFELDDEDPLSRSVSSCDLFSRGASDGSGFFSDEDGSFFSADELEGPFVCGAVGEALASPPNAMGRRQESGENEAPIGMSRLGNMGPPAAKAMKDRILRWITSGEG